MKLLKSLTIGATLITIGGTLYLVYNKYNDKIMTEYKPIMPHQFTAWHRYDTYQVGTCCAKSSVVICGVVGGVINFVANIDNTSDIATSIMKLVSICTSMFNDEYRLVPKVSFDMTIINDKNDESSELIKSLIINKFGEVKNIIVKFSELNKQKSNLSLGFDSDGNIKKLNSKLFDKEYKKQTTYQYSPLIYVSP